MTTVTAEIPSSDDYTIDESHQSAAMNIVNTDSGTVSVESVDLPACEPDPITALNFYGRPEVITLEVSSLSPDVVSVVDGFTDISTGADGIGIAELSPLAIASAVISATNPVGNNGRGNANAVGITSVNWQTYDPTFDTTPDHPEADGWQASKPLQTVSGGAITEIFPELEDPADPAGEARNYVFATAHSSSAVAGQTVYFAIYDYQSTVATARTAASNGLNYTGGIAHRNTPLTVSAGVHTVTLPATIIAALSLNSFLLISTPPAQVGAQEPQFGRDSESVLITAIDRTSNTITANFRYAHAGNVTLSWSNRGDPTPAIPAGWFKDPTHPPIFSGAVAYLSAETDGTGTARVRFSVAPQPTNDYEVVATTDPVNFAELNPVRGQICRRRRANRNNRGRSRSRRGDRNSRRWLGRMSYRSGGRCTLNSIE